MTMKVEKLDRENFEHRVVAAKRPVLVDFYADWCAPCRVVAPLVDQLAEDYADRIGVFKVDVDASPDLASRFGVRSIPTLVLFKDGKPVETLVGVVTRGQLSGVLDNAAA
jgi:thioredoxin 1